MATLHDAPFDIVATYHRLLAEDPDLTMPVAAIEALILALASTPASTVSETLDRVSTLTATLKRSVPNSISLSAGTDLFQQYLITSLQRPSSLGRGSGSGSSGGPPDFEHVRAHLVQNGKLFVARAKAARTTIASFGRHFIHDGTTVLTNGGSRVVGALLQSAAAAPSTTTTTTTSSSSPLPSPPTASTGTSGVRFRVIYVVSPSEHASGTGEAAANIAALRARDVPVATIPPTAVAHCLERVTQCFVGAEGVVENGGAISRLGTYQLGVLARAAGKPFYVVCESHKFVRLYPLGQRDLGLKQKVVDFRTARGSVGEEEEEEGEGTEGVRDEGIADMGRGEQVGEDGSGPHKAVVGKVEDFVDYTPPHLISGIITESGVLLPSAVSEELIKIWF